MQAPSTETNAQAAGQPRKWRQAWVWAVGLGLMAWLLHKVPLDAVLTAMRRPDPSVWAVTLLGLLFSYLLRAGRLQVVMGLGMDAPAGGSAWLGLRLDALRVILMHNAAVNLLPMRAGELSFPFLASRILKMPVSRAVASLLWMRLQDMAVLVSLGLLCWPSLATAWRAAGLLAVVIGWHAGVRLLGWLQRQQGGQGEQGEKIGMIAKLHQALLDPHHHHWSTWAFTWANWGIKMLAGAWLMAAIGGFSLGAAWAGALGGELAAIVPIQGPAGFGTYEAGVWGGLALATHQAAAMLPWAVPAALALHLCFLLCAVLAGALAWGLSSTSLTHTQGLPANTRIPD